MVHSGLKGMSPPLNSPMQDAPLASLAGLSSVFDLANGLRGQKSLLSAVYAYELSGHAGHAPSVGRAAFYIALLRHLGCTAFAHREASFGDDVKLRKALLLADVSKPVQVARSVWRANADPVAKSVGLGRLLFSSTGLQQTWVQEACSAARVLASGLRMDSPVLVGLDEVFERWDGRGGPAGLQGESISIAGRIAHVAHVAALFWLNGGAQLASDALHLQSGSVLDPALATLAQHTLLSLAAVSERRLTTLEASLLEAPLATDPLSLATTFGEFADLQNPYTRGQSTRVAAVCADAARALRFTAAETEQLVLAAHLRDLGNVTLPTGLFLQKRWSTREQTISREHPAATLRLLEAAPLFRVVAGLAASHHERLDGSGYSRGIAGLALGPLARLLAVADVWTSLQRPRTHRAALSRTSAENELWKEVKLNRLDARSAEAVLERSVAPKRFEPNALSEREIEVLQRLATGLSNKAIAQQLGLSARTVQHHSIHIYQKLQVKTRAAATLVAARLGLVN